MGQRGELYTRKVYAEDGEKTYFFNVKENRYGDLFLNLAESNKRENGQFSRHSIMIYREDFKKFKEVFYKALQYLQKDEKSPNPLEFHPASGKRSYQFNIHVNRKATFMLITENRRDKDMQFQNETIRLDKAQSEPFLQAFKGVMRFLDNSERKIVVKMNKKKPGSS